MYSFAHLIFFPENLKDFLALKLLKGGGGVGKNAMGLRKENLHFEIVPYFTKLKRKNKIL